MNTAVNMNNTINMNGGNGMNQAVNMNGGYGMNNVVYFNGANNMSNMNNQFMGIQVNQELVSYLEQGKKIFSYYEQFCAKYDAAREEDEVIQNKQKKITNRWRWIIISAPLFAFSLVTGTKMIKALISVGAAAAAILARLLIKPLEDERAMRKSQESNVQMAAWKEQKVQLDANIESSFGYVPEKYRSSHIMDYMLELARTGRVWDMNQAYVHADNELHRMAMEQAQREMMEAQREASADAVAGSMVAAGAGALLGGLLGACSRDW